MSGFLKVAVAQSDAGLCGQQERLTWVEQQLQTLEQDNIDLFILPELFLSGYNIGAKLKQAGIDKTSAAFAKITALAKQFNVAIHFSYPEKQEHRLYNAASCIAKTGEVLSTHRKLALPPGFETALFDSGSNYNIFNIGGFSIATLICYDAEFPENFRALAAADLVIVPTALFAQWGIVADKLIPTRAFENGVYVCYANHCGVENGAAYYGGSCIIAPDGDTLARASEQQQVISAVLDKNKVTAARKRLPYHKDRLQLPTG